MNRIAAIIIAFLFMAGIANAQGKQQLCFPSSGTATNCVPVTPVNPYPVTATISGSATITGTVTGTITATQGTSPWVSGSAIQTASTPTVQAAAYAAGNCIGGFNAVTITETNGQSGFVTNFRVSSLAGATPTFTVFLFDSQPTTSVCTDKSTFSLSATDVDKLIAVPTAITLAAPTSITTPSVASLDFTPPRPFKAGGSSSSGVKTIYYGIVTSAITPSSTSDFHTRIGAALN